LEQIKGENIMKRYSLKKSIGIAVVPLMVMAACGSEDIANNGIDSHGECRLILDASIRGFDTESTTRGEDYEWPDGSRIYLLFSDGDRRVDGKAVYDKDTDIWILNYNGVLSATSSSLCSACYFGNAEKEEESTFMLTASNPVYRDLEGKYSRDSRGVTVSLYLTPATGRIRFKGAKGTALKLSGVRTPGSFDCKTGELKRREEIVSLNIGEDGFSPYVYASLPVDSRILKIAYDKYSFTTECENGVLADGESGYMDVPQESAHNGWDMKVISLPVLGKTVVSEIGKAKATLSSVLSDMGNGSVTDCGFCYSQSSSPTVGDVKISCGPSSEKFGTTITGLTENTTYHVRSYAVNELGAGYGEEITFTTLAVKVPSLSEVTLGTVSNTSALVEATVTSSGNGTLQDAGFAYSDTPYPTVETGKVSCGNTETLKATIANLKPETKYYVRAYAVNEKGISYGEEKSFTTPKNAVIPYTEVAIETSFGYYKFDMATVTGGSFMMGAQGKTSSDPNYDPDAYSDEDPVHKVKVSTFLMGKTVVTQKLWYVVMGSYPALTSSNGLGDDYPVYNVTYDQCCQFIEKLSKLTGKKFRLPTEAEWEFAARGGVNGSGLKYSGNSTVGTVAWYSGNSGGKLHEVMKRSPNELNIYDMSGNIWEWCSDWYGNYSIKDQSDPAGPVTGSVRVVRGGCYSDAARECRVSVRSSAMEASALPTIGFRLVMEKQ